MLAYILQNAMLEVMENPDHLYQVAISGIVSALIWVSLKLWKRSEECERWRAEKEPEINHLMHEFGRLSALAEMTNACDTEGCPLAGKIQNVSLTQSIHDEGKNHSYPRRNR